MINYCVLTVFVLANKIKSADDAVTGLMLLGSFELFIELVILGNYIL
jgi:hypothetical protein